MRALYLTVKLLILLVFLYPVHAKADEITQMCQEKWGSDYEMVNYCTNNQRKAKSDISNYSGIIRNDCENKWAHNYEMILYCIKNQSEAKRAIDNTIKDEISSFCENKWGNNFEMVEYCIRNQRDAKQKVISESDNIRRPIQGTEYSEGLMKVITGIRELFEIEKNASANGDYCAAWKACAEQHSLLFWYQFSCIESDKEIIKDMLRQADVRRGTLYAQCVEAEGQRMEKELRTLEQGKKKTERSSTLKKNAVAPQVSKRGFTDPTTGMEFIFVKGGCYQMGGLRQKSGYIRTDCIDRIDFSPYYLHAIWQSDNRRHPWKKN